MTWAVPDWWAFLLLALAAYRVWRLLAHDTILDPVRRRLLTPDDETGKRWEFISCPYCLGAWVTAAWWLAWLIWPHGSLVVAAPFALSAVVALVAVNGERD